MFMFKKLKDAPKDSLYDPSCPPPTPPFTNLKSDVPCECCGMPTRTRVNMPKVLDGHYCYECQAEKLPDSYRQGTMIMLAETAWKAKDFKKMAEWYQRAADLGNQTAQYFMGEAYEKGEGVEQDFKKAAEWYRKSSDKGEILARHALGVCYLNGRGVEKDTAKAKELLTWCAQKGLAQSKKALEDLGG